MPVLNDWSREELTRHLSELRQRYQNFQKQNLRLDITRGKPCAEQLDLSNGLLTCLREEDYRAADGTDCRNYGGLDGLSEAKALFAAYMGVAPDEIILGGNSSLTLMYDSFLRAMLWGAAPGMRPWSGLARVRFLCPCPGYDRHFAICTHLGIETIAVPMHADGPDMDLVERLVGEDDSIKGIWCVPRYSNPTGAVYSAEIVARLAQMKTKAPDFRIFWDDAYAEHHLVDDPPVLANILAAAKAAGNAERPLMFGSTSKVTFPGAGVAILAGSRPNMDWVRKQLFFQTIGPDKLNQLRHVRFFGSLERIRAHMRNHAAILRPRFAAVQTILHRELDGKGIASWTDPQGGYFVSFDAPADTARTIVAMADAAGVKLTPAGATFPSGRDPQDRNIRIAPTFPPLEDVRAAVEVLAVCTQIAAIDKRLAAA
jgi:aspartate/methionine/tyrosine aminotransferase